MSYVYIKTEPSLWTVGFYKPDGKFEPESDHITSQAASKRVAWLNGGSQFDDDLDFEERLIAVENILDSLREKVRNK